MPEEAIARERLDSWKAIATYLGRNERTVVRWEKVKGLPVHRVPGGQRHAVFAYRDELDEWLTGAERANGTEQAPTNSYGSNGAAQGVPAPTHFENPSGYRASKARSIRRSSEPCIQASHFWRCFSS